MGFVRYKFAFKIKLFFIFLKNPYSLSSFNFGFISLFFENYLLEICTKLVFYFFDYIVFQITILWIFGCERRT